jgi:hypothetical protein
MFRTENWDPSPRLASRQHAKRYHRDRKNRLVKATTLGVLIEIKPRYLTKIASMITSRREQTDESAR